MIRETTLNKGYSLALRLSSKYFGFCLSAEKRRAKFAQGLYWPSGACRRPPHAPPPVSDGSVPRRPWVAPRSFSGIAHNKRARVRAASSALFLQSFFWRKTRNDCSFRAAVESRFCRKAATREAAVVKAKDDGAAQHNLTKFTAGPFAVAARVNCRASDSDRSAKK